MSDLVIDAHVHVFRPAAVSVRPVDALAPAERDAPVEELLQTMRHAGVDAAVLVPLGGEDGYVASCLHARPTTFAAIAVADDAAQGRRPGVDPVTAVTQRRWRFPFHGLRTQWLGEPGEPVDQSPMFPVLQYLARHGLVLWSYLTRDQLPLLEPLARALPDLPVVLNHLGFCPHDMRVDAHRRPRFETAFDTDTLTTVLRLAVHPQIQLMFSGHYALSREDVPFHDLGDDVRRLADAYGITRMMWASDYPWTRDVPGLRALQRIPEALLPGLTRVDRSAILGGNAKRLFPHLRRGPSED